MTKTELLQIVETMASGQERKFRSCKATVRRGYTAKLSYHNTTVTEVEILRSYSTDVAIYIPATSTAIILGSWSMTTWQHVNKWLKELTPYKTIYLTAIHNQIQVKTNKHWNDKYYTKPQIATMIETDWAELLGGYSIR